jgi:hypothetical protein
MRDVKKCGQEKGGAPSSWSVRRNLVLLALACVGGLLWQVAPSNEAVAQRAHTWGRAHQPAGSRGADASPNFDMDARSLDSDLDPGAAVSSPSSSSSSMSARDGALQGADPHPSSSSSSIDRRIRRDSRCREVEDPDHRWRGPDGGKKPFCTDASGGSSAEIKP